MDAVICNKTVKKNHVHLVEWFMYCFFVVVDDVVEYKLGEKSAQTMYSAGFQNLTFRSYNG